MDYLALAIGIISSVVIIGIMLATPGLNLYLLEPLAITAGLAADELHNITHE